MYILILNFISLTLCLDGRGWMESKKEDDQNVRNLTYKKFGHLPSTLLSSPSTFETKKKKKKCMVGLKLNFFFLVSKI